MLQRPGHLAFPAKFEFVKGEPLDVFSDLPDRFNIVFGGFFIRQIGIIAPNRNALTNMGIQQRS